MRAGRPPSALPRAVPLSRRDPRASLRPFIRPAVWRSRPGWSAAPAEGRRSARRSAGMWVGGGWGGAAVRRAAAGPSVPPAGTASFAAARRRLPLALRYLSLPAAVASLPVLGCCVVWLPAAQPLSAVVVAAVRCGAAGRQTKAVLRSAALCCSRRAAPPWRSRVHFLPALCDPGLNSVKLR